MTIHFADVSHYQAKLSLKGLPAVIAKATQGTSFVDSAYAGFKAEARALGIPFAAYHWPDTSDLAAQARHAYSVIGPGTAVMWDAEATGATVPRLLDLTAKYRALGGVAKLVYLPRWWWQNIGSPDLRPLAVAGLALVSSNYPAAGYAENGPGWTPYGGVTPTVWQYTSTFAFAGQRIDFNAYKGTASDLARLFATATTSLEDDMALSDEDSRALIWRVKTLLDNAPVVAGGPTAGEVNRLAVALAAANDEPITDAQLAELVAAAKAGAEAGVDEALDGATVTTVIHSAE